MREARTDAGGAADEVEILPTERAEAFVLRIGGRDQSHVDLGDPTRLAFDYVRRIGDVLDAHGEPGAPLRVVHVGGAGLTLPRYVATVRPRSAQIVLEPATHVTDLVRERLPLPRRSGIKVRPEDGRTGLGALRDGQADVVVLDAFDQGRVPGDLVTQECAATVARVLAPDGLYVLNLTDRAPFEDTRRVVAGLRAVFGDLMLSAEPATLRARRTGNLVVVASRAPVPLRALRERAASSGAPYRVLDAAQVSSSFGGGLPLHDPA